MNVQVATKGGGSEKQWMLYGCYGYSGKLILKEAILRGLTPIIAGRSEEKTRLLAERYELDYRVFDLHDAQIVEDNISDCHFVFNAAGPYSSTCVPMLKACLSLGVHNLSLAGEIPILEELSHYNTLCRDRHVVLAPGLGFDVMPTDALCNLLKQEMPDARELIIGLDGPNDMSRGSMKEFFEQIGEQPFWVRKNGRLVKSSPKTKRLDFGSGKKLASAIAWGDTASAYHSTGIPNIEVYSSVSPADWLLIKTLSAGGFLFKSKRVQHALNYCIDKIMEGPDEQSLEELETHIFIEGVNEKGHRIRISLVTPSAYKMTYLGAVTAIEYMLNQESLEGGYYTPAQLLGCKTIFQIQGVGDPHIERFQ